MECVASCLARRVSSVNGCCYHSFAGIRCTPTAPLTSHTHPLPGVWGLVMAPITASVARVAFRGSDSNH